MDGEAKWTNFPSGSCRIVIGGGARLSKEMLSGIFALNNWQVVSEGARDYEGLCLAVKQHCPDVALVLPWVGGIQNLSDFSRLREIQPQVGLVFLIRPYDTLELLYNVALEYGAIAVIDSETSIADLIAAIYLVKSQFTIFSPEVLSRMPRTYRPPLQKQTLTVPLNPPERASLQCVAQGLSESAIASLLGVSVRSIQGYVARARDKLSASNSVHAVALALEAGLIEGPSNSLR